MFTLRVKKMILSQKYQNFRKNTTFVPLPIRRNNMKQVEEPAVVYDTTFEQITYMPSIGVLVKKSSDKEYRKLLAHPKSWIYYCYDNNELHILDIRSSVMK